MSKVTYNGCTFDITHDGMTSWSGYDIRDDEGYRLVLNFNDDDLGRYRGAVDLTGESDRELKIVLDFAPYMVDIHTLRNNNYHHSLWAKPDYNLSKFWKYLELM